MRARFDAVIRYEYTEVGGLGSDDAVAVLWARGSMGGVVLVFIG